MTPTVRAGVILTLIAISSVAIPVAVTGLLAVGVVAAFVVDGLAIRRPITITRQAPAMVSRGVAAPLRIELQAVGPGSASVRQARPPDLEITPAVGVTALHANITGVRRGVHELPPAAARVVGPLGLACRYRRSTEVQEIRVYPDLPTAFRIARLVRTGRFSDAGHAPRGPLGLGTEFELVRDYVPDDDVRQINWRATARVGRPMSNQFRMEQDRDVVILVDCGRLMGAPLGEATRLDLAVDAAVAVASVADELGDHCGVIVFDTAVRRLVRPHRRSGNDVIEAVFDVEPSAVDSDYLTASRHVGGTKRALVLIFTDLIERTAAEPLVQAVGVLSRRHRVVVVCAVDESMDELIRRDPVDARDAYEAAVAQGAIAERRHVIGALHASGAQVVEAPAARMAAASVSAYLTAKRQGRL
jgi:uncharacterized protein (DUF58 family)